MSIPNQYQEVGALLQDLARCFRLICFEDLASDASQDEIAATQPLADPAPVVATNKKRKRAAPEPASVDAPLTYAVRKPAPVTVKQRVELIIKELDAIYETWVAKKQRYAHVEPKNDVYFACNQAKNAVIKFETATLQRERYEVKDWSEWRARNLSKKE